MGDRQEKKTSRNSKERPGRKAGQKRLFQWHPAFFAGLLYWQRKTSENGGRKSVREDRRTEKTGGRKRKVFKDRTVYRRRTWHEWQYTSGIEYFDAGIQWPEGYD